ncbi:DUF5629 family protein [Pseudomonas sp. 10B1]|uniref:DUF5629 family protein n=1 Tax=unclassified Pseudomonas TaxID=196821 RepID=UPI002AB4F7EF|nr:MULTISPECIES: DUF5629 family protein [unclassified Pseudomonas]MDY7559411.1 DUF5629 family protein [Pseudomonas sp. AB6]MEA9979829.1 DUF5629 family protein [Pseudomonas sp. RTS4]MEA9996631.1 DUF5629 family protein [Pseudomonas sp. AA4]MEB0087930.1 DUF5629 family protein [Pseudomonas sp. RTI1]MEB0128127.1 DUF5629 family protein [Pseudomonas sp. CCC1.2]
MTTPTLLSILQTPHMLEIDGLHAFEFLLNDTQLEIEAVDGRERKVWKFSVAQVEAATFDAQLQSWVLTDGNADHRLVCLEAFSPSDEDDSEDPAEQD